MLVNKRVFKKVFPLFIIIIIDFIRNADSGTYVRNAKGVSELVTTTQKPIPEGTRGTCKGNPNRHCDVGKQCGSNGVCYGEIFSSCKNDTFCLRNRYCSQRNGQKQCLVGIGWKCDDDIECIVGKCKPLISQQSSNTYCYTQTQLVGQKCTKNSECLPRADTNPICSPTHGVCCINNGKAFCEKDSDCCNGICQLIGGMNLDQRECCPKNKVGFGKSCNSNGDCCAGNCKNGKCDLS